MEQDKVNTNCTPAGSEAGNVNETLRILAKMIARHLMTKKQGVDEQHPSARGSDT